jgi:hypothetical protein
MNTPKEVFTYIRDEEGYLEREEYICVAVDTLRDKSKIEESLWKECRNLIQENKPQDDSFTKHKYWYGSIAWWGVLKAEEDDKLEEVFAEKRRFLTYLIDKL